MKTILYILIIAALLSCSSCKYDVYISPELQDYVDQFVEEATSRGLPGLKIVNRVDSIIYKPISKIYLGLYWPKTFNKKIPHNVIYINSDVPIPNYTIRKTVFHEIAHSHGLRHVCYRCNRIMSSISDGVVKDEEGWQKDLDIFFEREKLSRDKIVIFVR